MDHDQETADTVFVPVHSLTAGDTPRLNGEDAEHIRRLAQYDGELPPILVNMADNSVIDGAHRLAAARLRGDTTVKVRYFNGKPDEAFLVAVKSNANHGLPLTLADREAAARRIIRSHPGLSDRALAATTSLSAHTVARLRAELNATNGVRVGKYRLGRDGRSRPTDATEGRLAAQSLIRENPRASLREIAVIAGISPATVRDVRLRIERGEDAVPRPRRSATAAHEPAEAEQPPDPQPDVDEDAGRNQEHLLEALRRDPSLRFSERGRALLRWITLRAAGPAGWRTIVDVIPAHSGYLVAELARRCADEWLAFADRIENRNSGHN
jgi:ParB-like chromosome segregation protein Spo0J